MGTVSAVEGVGYYSHTNNVTIHFCSFIEMLKLTKQKRSLLCKKIFRAS